MRALGLPRDLGGPRRSTEIQSALGSARNVPGPRQQHLAAEEGEANRCQVVRMAGQQQFNSEVRARTRAGAELIRYADDALLVFANEAHARRVLDVLPKRFGRCGLRLHPRKTQLVYRAMTGRRLRFASGPSGHGSTGWDVAHSADG